MYSCSKYNFEVTIKCVCLCVYDFGGGKSYFYDNMHNVHIAQFDVNLPGTHLHVVNLPFTTRSQTEYFVST